MRRHLNLPFPRPLANRSQRTLSLAAAGLCALALLSGCGSGLGSVGTSAPPAIAATNGPQLGYLWVATDKTLRPILGVAGASQVGQSVVPAGAYQSAVTSAAGTFALMQAADASFDVVALPTGTSVALPVSLPSGATLRLSSSGAAAALYSPGASSAAVITGLPNSPVVRTVSASAPIVDAAVSDTGSIAVEVAQGSSLIANVVTLDGKSHTVASLGASGGLTFLPGRDDLLLVDSAANTLTLIASASSAPAASTFPTGTLLQAPLAVGVSQSGRWALVANSAGNGLVRLDLRQRTSSAVACACTPTLAAPLADDGAFRVTALPADPNWVVEANAATPRVLFLPAVPGVKKVAIPGGAQ